MKHLIYLSIVLFVLLVSCSNPEPVVEPPEVILAPEVILEAPRWISGFPEEGIPPNEGDSGLSYSDATTLEEWFSLQGIYVPLPEEWGATSNDLYTWYIHECTDNRDILITLDGGENSLANVQMSIYIDKEEVSQAERPEDSLIWCSVENPGIKYVCILIVWDSQMEPIFDFWVMVWTWEVVGPFPSLPERFWTRSESGE